MGLTGIENYIVKDGVEWELGKLAEKEQEQAARILMKKVEKAIKEVQKKDTKQKFDIQSVF